MNNRQTTPVRRLLPRLAVLLGTILGLVGCSSSGPTTFEIQPTEYPAAFEAAKEAVRYFRFPLQRVDYVQGEISTDSKYSSGIATPWDPDQSTLENEWEDYTNMQGRNVRIRFEPVSQATGLPDQPGTQVSVAPAGVAIESATEPIVAQVIVTISRVNRPGWRPQTKAVRRSSFTEDPELTARRMFPAYEVTITRDEKLAARIVERMKKTLAAVPPAPAPAAPEATTEAPPEATSEANPDGTPDRTAEQPTIKASAR